MGCVCVRPLFPQIPLAMGYARIANLELLYVHVECASMCSHPKECCTVQSFLSQDFMKE